MTLYHTSNANNIGLLTAKCTTNKRQHLFLLLACWLAIPGASLSAQDYILGTAPASNLATITTCSGTFYDSGGQSSNYAHSSDLSTTFTSANGGVLQMNFTAFSLEVNAACPDYLSIFDGTSSLGTLIGTYCGTTSPGTVTSTTGSLHFVFHSNSNTRSTGWSANISCLANPNYPTPDTCSDATVIIGDLLPAGGGQTIAFRFADGQEDPIKCTATLPYGGEGIQACANTGKVYIARPATTDILVWDAATKSAIDSIPSTLGAGYDIALDATCTYLYVASTGGIERINLATSTVDATRSRADLDAAVTGSGEPWGIDIHPTTSEVYVTFGWESGSATYGSDKRSSILKLASNLSGTITTVVPDVQYGFFMGLEFLPNGRFWVTWNGDQPPSFPFPYVHKEEIQLYTDAGALLASHEMFLGVAQDKFLDPNDIAFGPDGNIYVELSLRQNSA